MMQLHKAERKDPMADAKKRLIIFTDIGDTIIDESTEVRNAEDIVIHADCIPGAKETYLRLHEMGYTIVMVADGLTQSFRNTMKENGLSHIFAAWIISEEVGEDKPSPKMFAAAMEKMRLTEADKSRILMIGNNVKRDIRGANRFGISTRNCPRITRTGASIRRKNCFLWLNGWKINKRKQKRRAHKRRSRKPVFACYCFLRQCVILHRFPALLRPANLF